MDDTSQTRSPSFSWQTPLQILFVFKESFKLALKVQPINLFIIIVLGSVWGLTTLPNMYLFKLIIDTIVDNIKTPNPEASITQLVIYVGGLGLINLFRTHISNTIWALRWLLNQRAQVYIDNQIRNKVADLDISTLEDPKFRDKLQKIKKTSSSRVWDMIFYLSELPQNVFGAASSLIPILVFNPIISVLLVLINIPRIVKDARIAKKEYDLEEKLSNTNRLWGKLENTVDYPRNNLEPKIFGNVATIVKKIDSVSQIWSNAWQAYRISWVKTSFVADLPAWSFSTAFNGWLLIQALLGKLTLGTAQFTYSSSENFRSYIGSILANAVKIYQNYLYIKDLLWLLSLKSASKSGSLKVPDEITQGIELRNVSFRYPKTTKWILRGINLTISPKENLAIVGENGAGKTTLIKLLCKFYEPTEGEILLNGVNIQEYDERAYWNNISALFQDFEHYPFTAKESITLGKVEKEHQMEEIIESTKLSGIHDYISELELGYDTPLAKDFDKGVEPSGGQWQRISLARTLLRGGNILILDEPTSNVDPKAEEEIFEKVMKIAKDKILILISHRFSTVRRANKIILIEKGKLTEAGTHEELMKKNGSYAKLFKMQAKGYL